MPSKKRKRESTWDEIGEMIGRKIEKETDGCTCKAPFWHHKENGGGCGRFLFIAGIIYAMHLTGSLPAVPVWLLAVIVIGFSLMRF